MDTPTKDQLINDLKDSFAKVDSWINKQPDDKFNTEIVSGKWSVAGVLYHLIKSTKAVSQGMAMPKDMLEQMFGKSSRVERTYDEMDNRYRSIIIEKSVIAPKQFEAEEKRIFEKPALLKRFDDELNDMISAFNKWEESDMSLYILPHPAIGKCTIREFLYFTIIHTYHHLETLKEKYEV